MSLIIARNISKYFAHEPIIKNVNFVLSKWDRVALIWKNWSWKSTLFRIISWIEKCDWWEIIVAKWTKLSILEQYENINLDINILEYIFLWQKDEKFQILKKYLDINNSKDSYKLESIADEITSHWIWELEMNIKKILTKLNIINLSLKLSTLSWWELKRLSLAKILIQESDIILLDEPTNHLDLEMIEWLEEYLKTNVKTFFIITHDRYFLDRVCTKIIEIDDCNLYEYNWIYSYYIEKKSEREEIILKEKQNAMTLYKKELNWIRRQPQWRQTKAKARIEAFDDIKKRAFVSLKSQKLEIDIFTKRLWTKILELKNISKSFSDKIILDNFNFIFSSWSRFWFVWKNWAWKSTLLDIITWNLKPDNWEIIFWSTVEVAYFRQDFTDFNSTKKIIDIATEISQEVMMSNWQKISASRLLDMFNFPPKIQYEKVSILSYGQKKRLYLATLLLKNPNFLILDEPTNDLDIFTLTKLEEFLVNFNWCIIIVSHDRYFLDKLVDHLLVFEWKWEIKMFSGTYSEYKIIKTEEEYEIKKEVIDIGVKKQISNKEQNRLNKIEKELKDIDSKKLELKEKLNDIKLSNDEIVKLSIEYWEIEKKSQELENEWLEITEKYLD